MNDKSSRNKAAAIFLEGYLTACKEMEVPLRAVCERLGEILSTPRQRISEYMPVVRTYSKRNTSRRKAVESVEGDGNTHRRAQASAKKAHALRGRKQTWWYKLSKAQKQEIIAKRVAATKARKEKAA